MRRMRRKKLMTAALPVLALMLLLTLSGCTSAGNTAQKQAPALQSDDGKDSLKADRNWSKAQNSLYPTAELIVKGSDSDYVAVVKKSKSELPEVNSTNDFFTYVKGKFTLLATDISWGESADVKVGKLSGLAVTLQGTGRSSGKKLSYWIDLLEGSNCYYEIVGWGDASRASADSHDIQSIMKSFQST